MKKNPRNRCTVVRLATSSNIIRATRTIFAIYKGFKPIDPIIKKENKYSNPKHLKYVPIDTDND